MNSLQKLGFSEETKLLIIHADDVGLCHSENMASIESFERGIVNSYSIMVPCPWFYEIACYAKDNPKFDYGVHLTLTCEWENYKFGPVLPISEVPSLVDKNGHFFKKRAQLAEHANPEHVFKELQAQIMKALDFGLTPSHIDSHMYGVGARPEFFKIYKEVGRKFGLPALLSEDLMDMIGLDPKLVVEKGDFLVDHAYVADFKDFTTGNLRNYYSTTLDNLSRGLNILLIHPAFDDHEMQGVTVNHPNFGSKWRQIDFDFFTSKENMLKIQENDIQLITWKEVKEALIK